MEQPNYLIDTNSVIDYLGKKLPDAGMVFMNSVIDSALYLSVVTKIEVLGYNSAKEHYKLLTDFMEEATILYLSPLVVDACIEIRKKHKTKLPDAIIAATSLVYDLTLITRNTTDFKNMNGIKLIDPYIL